MVAIFLAILIPQIVESINSLAQSIYAFLPQAQQTLNEWTAKYGSNELLLNVLEILGIDVSDPSLALQRLATRSYTFLTQVLPNLFGGVMRFTSGLLNVVVGIIIAVYLLLSKEVFYAQVKKLMFAFFPRRAAQAVLNLTHDSNAIFCGFISGKIVDSAIIGVLCFIGCSVLQMPYTVLVSFIVGVTNVIPYFGPFIGAIPSIFIIMIDDPIKSLIFAVFILVLQQLDGNVIGPKILGDSTGLSAFWVLFAVTFFGGLFGFLFADPQYRGIQVGQKRNEDSNAGLRRAGLPHLPEGGLPRGRDGSTFLRGGLRPGRQASGDARAAGRLHGGQLQRGGRQIAACSKLFWNI